MGLWKRLSEQTKQTFGLKGGADWKPTSNARNTAMIEDARKFAKQLKAMHREFIQLQKNIDGSFTVFKTVLNAPLPRIYELSDKGPIPVDKSTTIVGTNVNFDIISAAAKDLKERLEKEVLHPLEQWLAAYRSIKQRNVKCDEIRLELDAKRRAAHTLHVAFERQKTKISSGGAKPEGDSMRDMNDPANNKLQHAEYKYHTEEDKVQRLSQRYKDVEEEVFTALKHLIADTTVLKQYAAASLVVYENTFRQAYAAFDLSAPVPIRMTSQGGTPIPQPSTGGAAAPITTAAPEWYNAAKDNPGTMRYDSDDDTK